MAKHVGYWTDLTEMPAEGPFVVGLAPFGDFPRIEHANGPTGVGCPQMLGVRMYRYMERHCIPRGEEGADWLNKLWHEGALQWDGHAIVPKELEDFVPADLDQYVSFGDLARDRILQQCQYASRLIGKLGYGLRWWSSGPGYHSIMIHQGDTDECFRRWRDYYVSNGIKDAKEYGNG